MWLLSVLTVIVRRFSNLRRGIVITLFLWLADEEFWGESPCLLPKSDCQTPALRATSTVFQTPGLRDAGPLRCERSREKWALHWRWRHKSFLFYLINGSFVPVASTNRVLTVYHIQLGKSVDEWGSITLTNTLWVSISPKETATHCCQGHTLRTAQFCGRQGGLLRIQSAHFFLFLNNYGMIWVVRNESV